LRRWREGEGDGARCARCQADGSERAEVGLREIARIRAVDGDAGDGERSGAVIFDRHGLRCAGDTNLLIAKTQAGAGGETGQGHDSVAGERDGLRGAGSVIGDGEIGDAISAFGGSEGDVDLAGGADGNSSGRAVVGLREVLRIESDEGDAGDVKGGIADVGDGDDLSGGGGVVELLAEGQSRGGNAGERADDGLAEGADAGTEVEVATILGGDGLRSGGNGSGGEDGLAGGYGGLSQ